MLGFEISTQMGRFLVETGRVELTSLRSIQAAYAAVFGDRSETLFSTYTHLEAVSQIRNCFAHRRGRVDQRSLRSIQHIPGLQGIDLGDTIVLTGPIVRDCVNLLADSSVSLIRFVDSWLVEEVTG